MRDQFLLWTLHLKYICYDPINTMYNNHARDPMTTIEMRNRGMRSHNISVSAIWSPHRPEI